MLQQIKDLPQHVAGVYAVGNVTGGEYESVVKPLLDEKVKQYGKINYILILETSSTHFTLNAWRRDLRLMLRYYWRWKKIAVVTDRKGVEWFTDVFRFIMPGKSRRYPLDRLDEAIRWVSEK